LSINTILFIGYISLFGREKIDAILIIMSLFLLLVNFFPVVLLHIQYSIINSNAILTIDTIRKTISYKKGDKIFEYNFSDIQNLKYYATSGHISTKGSSERYTFDGYRYYKIVMNDNNEIIITCLMINNIDNKLEQMLGLEAERRFRAIPLVY
jgi:hypothetical protein